MAQSIWSLGCTTWAQKRVKKHKNTFLALFWAHVISANAMQCILWLPLLAATVQSCFDRNSKEHSDSMSPFWWGYYQFRVVMHDAIHFVNIRFHSAIWLFGSWILFSISSFAQLLTKIWYFVTKIVLSFCVKKLF